MKIDKGIDQIRNIIAHMEGSEREVYEALMNESTGWQMRLEELDAEEEDEA